MPLVERTISLVNDSKAPGHARRAVGNALLAWEYEEALADDAVLLASELVTNAVRYAPGSPTLTLRLRIDREALTVEVYDSAIEPPRPLQPGAEDERGRGLPIVEALVREHKGRCGYRAYPGGKSVFFVLRVPPVPTHVHQREAVLAGTVHAVAR